MALGTLANSIAVYPVEFFRQNLATVAKNYMLPCKYNLGVVTMAQRQDVLQNNGFVNTSYWSSSGLTGVDIRFGYGSAKRYAYFGRHTGAQAVVSSSTITLASASATTGSMMVWSNVATTAKLDIVGLASGVVLDTATSGFVNIPANRFVRLNVTSTYTGSVDRQLRITVGDNVTDITGAELMLDEAELVYGQSAGITFEDERSDTTVRTVTAGQLRYDLRPGQNVNLDLPFTFSFWTRVTNSGALNADNGVLYSFGDTTGPVYKLRYSESSQNLVLTAPNAAGSLNIDTITITGVNLNPNDVVFFALRATKTKLKVYYKINDNAIQSLEADNVYGMSFNPYYLHLGHDENTANHWEGPIEQALIHDVALTDAEITAIANSTTGITMMDDSRIFFAAITPQNDNGFYTYYLKLGRSDYSPGWDGSWRNADIRARISNNETNTGKAVMQADLTLVQRETNWSLGGGSSSYPQSVVWDSAFVAQGNDWYYSNFYCTNPNNPDWSLWETRQILHMPNTAPVIIVDKRWGNSAKERDAIYLAEQTMLTPWPGSQRTYGALGS